MSAGPWAARSCWCGNSEFAPFNAEYGHCRVCGTLVSQVGLSVEELRVEDDETSFYGKQYWLDHQKQDLGFPDIHARARKDLTERNLHWLKALLKYRPPGGKAVELGCAHGSFVALMAWAGWDASGVEMSPWVVEFGRRTFAVPLHVGPVENVGFAPASHEVVALMDVLEHLPDPVGTMRHCVELLAAGGMLLIQTPEFQEDMRYDLLVEQESPFLEQLKADEHLYLFSRRAVRLLFERLGAPHLAFEPAIFAQYDMFFACSPSALVPRSESEVEQSLLAEPGRRLPLALLDLRRRELEGDADRAARGEQIATLTAMVHEAVAREHELAHRLADSDTDRAARGEQIATLTRMVHEAAAREQEVARRLAESDADRAARGEQIAALTRMVHEAAAREQDVARQLAETDADRAVRGEQIETLTGMVHEANRRLAELDADRAARGDQIATLTRMVQESEADRARRGEQIELLTLTARQAQAREQSAAQRLQEMEAARAQGAEELRRVREQLHNNEVARVAQDAQIQELSARMQQLGADLQDTRAALARRLQRSAALSGELAVLLARPAFQRLAHLLRWREATGLRNMMSESNE